MKGQVIIGALAVVVPTLVAAQSNHSYSCTQGSLTRRVEVAYSGPADVPCEVRYVKDGESSAQVLWRAATQGGYCEAQARDFVAKLQSMAWVCSDSGTSPAPPPAAAAPRAGDDTEALDAGAQRD